MPHISKRRKAFANKVDPTKTYAAGEALKLVKETATAKFDEAIDVAVNLGIDAKKGDQTVRGSVVLPAGTGKKVRVAVFAPGDKATAAKAAGADSVDARRFRQNIYISGASPHLEDEWLDREVRVGGAVLRVKMRDPRCAITTHSPDTGEIDMNTLKIIASYRTDQPKEANFGVYCTIVEAGDVAVGDEVAPVTA